MPVVKLPLQRHIAKFLDKLYGSPDPAAPLDLRHGAKIVRLALYREMDTEGMVPPNPKFVIERAVDINWKMKRGALDLDDYKKMGAFFEEEFRMAMMHFVMGQMSLGTGTKRAMLQFFKCYGIDPDKDLPYDIDHMVWTWINYRPEKAVLHTARKGRSGRRDKDGMNTSERTAHRESLTSNQLELI